MTETRKDRQAEARRLYEAFLPGRLRQIRPAEDKDLLAAADLIDQLRAELNQARTDKDGAYLERNRLVAYLASQFPSGLKQTNIEGWDPEWHGCVFIDSPAGQLSWHYHNSHSPLFYRLPLYQGEWDGHTTEQKYDRLTELTVTHLGARP